jgi:hypothetical protein
MHTKEMLVLEAATAALHEATGLTATVATIEDRRRHGTPNVSTLDVTPGS